MKISKTWDVEIPTVPNFIRATNGYTMPVENFTDAQLRQIGKGWTAKLLTNARKRRGA